MILKQFKIVYYKINVGTNFQYSFKIFKHDKILKL